MGAVGNSFQNAQAHGERFLTFSSQKSAWCRFAAVFFSALDACCDTLRCNVITHGVAGTICSSSINTRTRTSIAFHRTCPVLDGSNFTSDLPFCDQNCCPLCKADGESIHHRHWECPATSWSRQQLSDTYPEFPECVRERGWAVVPPEVIAFRKSLLHVEDLSGKWCAGSVDAGWPPTLDMFTDGTAVCPCCPSTRLTGWSVVCLTASGAYHLVSCGTVPGVFQTVLRAEITAVLSAIKFASCLRLPARIWSDNALVVQRANAIISQDFRVTRTTTDSDLWSVLETWVEDGMPDISVHKVMSHVEISSESEVDQIVLVGNQWADHCAAEVVSCLPPIILQHHQAAQQAVGRMAHAVAEIVHHIGRVGMQVREAEKLAGPVAPPPEKIIPESEPPKECPSQVIDLRYVVQCLRQKSEFPFDSVSFGKLVHWAHEISQPPVAPVCVTWYELLVALQMASKVYGVQKRPDGSWQYQTLLGKPFDFKSSGRAFGTFLREACRRAYPSWKPVNARPHCPSFRCWTGTIWISCSIQWRDRIWDWFDKSFPLQDARQLGKALCQLQPAFQDDEAEPDPEIGLRRFWQHS